MTTTTPPPDHSQISFTAKLVAYSRAFTDIPYAKDVSELVDAPGLVADLNAEAGADLGDAAWMVPFIEARYKSIVSAIKAGGFSQVLEFASGVSLRGLAMTEDPAMVYVETDLPGLTAEKRRLLDEIRTRHHLPPRPRHHVLAANILDWDDIEPALAFFDPDRPVAVVHEGLLPYLSLEEKEAAGRNVRRILERFGGAWITPDFATMSSGWDIEASRPAVERMVAVIAARTSRDFVAAAFKDEAQLADFVKRLGLVATERPQLDGSYELSSQGAFPIPDDIMRRLDQVMKLWELRLPA